MPQRLLDVLVGVVQFPEIPRDHRQPLVADAELGIQFDGLEEALARFFEPVSRLRLHRRAVVMDDVERRRRQAGHGEHLRRFGRLVAERLADGRDQPSRGRKYLIPAGRPPSDAGDDIAGHRLRRLQRQVIAVAVAGDRARDDDPDPLLDRQLARCRLVEDVRRMHAEDADDARPIVGADEPRSFQRPLQHRLERVLEGWIAGAIPQVRDDDGYRRVLCHRCQAARVPPRSAAADHQQQRDDRRRQAQADDAGDGDEEALVVEPVEVGGQLGAALIAPGGIRLQAAGSQAVERFGHQRHDGARRRRRLLHPRLQLGDGADGMFGAPPSDQHVVEDQPEGVDVGSLVDRLPPRLLGRHVLDRPDDRALHRRRVRRRGGHEPGGRLAGRRAGWGTGRQRDAEVHDHRLVVRVDHDVGGFEIAVDDAGLVGGDQPRDHGAGDAQHLRDRQPPAP